MVAVAGKDFVIVASDTRLSEGYSIQTRDRVKFFKLTDSTVLGSTGCWCDVLAFVKVLNARIKVCSRSYHCENLNLNIYTSFTIMIIVNL